MTSELNKHGITLFYKDYRLPVAGSVGPQQAAFDAGQRLGHTCFVMYQYKLVRNRPLYSYGSLANQQDLARLMLQIDESERCFFEIITTGTPCREYYDIEWELQSSTPGDMEAEEQDIFRSLVHVLDDHMAEHGLKPCDLRVLSASSLSLSKGSLHVIVPVVYNDNHTDLHKHITAVKKRAPPEMLCKIDWAVYTRNRAFRLYGQHKRSDSHRPLKPAQWHLESRDADAMDFFVVCPNGAAMIHGDSPDKKNTTVSRHPCPRKEAVVPYQHAVQEHMLYNIFSSRFSTHYLFSPIDTSTARLRPIKGKLCLVCNRQHDSENAMLSCDNGRVLFRCFREPMILLDMSDEDDETKRGALFKYPGMCRWAMFLTGMPAKPLVELAGDLEYAVYGYNATELILYRSPDMLRVKAMSLACAVRTMTHQRQTVLQEVDAMQWHVAADHGALLRLKYSPRCTTLMAINVQPKQATLRKNPPTKPHRASALCKTGLVYTALQYYMSSSPSRLYVMLEDDTKKCTWVRVCKDSALYHAFQGQQPMVYRFMA